MTTGEPARRLTGKASWAEPIRSRRRAALQKSAGSVSSMVSWEIDGPATVMSESTVFKPRWSIWSASMRRLALMVQVFPHAPSMSKARAKMAAGLGPTVALPVWRAMPSMVTSPPQFVGPTKLTAPSPMAVDAVSKNPPVMVTGS